MKITVELTGKTTVLEIANALRTQADALYKQTKDSPKTGKSSKLAKTEDDGFDLGEDATSTEDDASGNSFLSDDEDTETEETTDEEETLETSDDEDEEEEEEKPAPVAKKKTATKETTKADVQAALARYSKNTSSAQAVKLLKKKFGVKSLHEIKPSQYKQVIAAVSN